MPHNRFFSSSDFESSSLHIEGEEAHHMKDVMRLQVGDAIELINGRGKLAHARVTKRGKADITLVLEKVNSFEKKEIAFCTGLPLLRPGHFDWALEKLVELDVDRIALFPADLSERKEMHDSFLKRSHKLVESAMKQSGRLFAPDLLFFGSLHEVLSSIQAFVLWADESAEETLLHRLQEHKLHPPYLLLSGPEKGWSEKERDLLREKGAPVLLTKTTLRAETAAILLAGTVSQCTI